MESREECLKEAAECDRLAGLANTETIRRMMLVIRIQMAQAGGKGNGPGNGLHGLSD